MINLSEPNISKKEISLVTKALNSKNLVDGYYQNSAEKLIKKIIKAKYVAVTQSCSSALEAASILINLKKNDEVLMPSYTFSSTANAVLLRGAKPIFVDILPNLNIDLDDLEKKITKKTRAIFVVHYGGMCCDIKKLIQIKKKYKLFLVEDAAHSFLSKYKNKYLGTFGDIAAYSFHATKNFVGGQAGALIVNNKKFIKDVDIILDKGTDRKKVINFKSKFHPTQRLKNKKVYSWKNIGSEYRASEISSALVYAQIIRRNELQKKRSIIWYKYLKNFSNFENVFFKILKPEKYVSSSYHNFVLITKTTKIAKKLTYYLYKEKKIFSSFHYIPLHIAPYSRKNLKNKQKLAITESLFNRVVRLPLHSNLSIKQVEHIIKSVKLFFKMSNLNNKVFKKIQK